MIIYKSRPNYFWQISIILAVIVVPIIINVKLTITYLMVSLFLIGSIGCIFTFYFIFYEDHFEKRRLLFGVFSFRTQNKSYKDILFVEVRKIKAPYQLPYVIFHYSAKRKNSKFFFQRAFIFKNVEEIKKFVEHLNKKNVNFKFSFSVYYKKELSEIQKYYHPTAD